MYVVHYTYVCSVLYICMWCIIHMYVVHYTYVCSVLYIYINMHVYMLVWIYSSHGYLYIYTDMYTICV